MEAGKEKTALELLCITSVCRGQGWAGLFCGFCRDHKVVRANMEWRLLHIIKPYIVHLVKVMAFPVVMYGCESWTVRKASTEKLMILNCGVGEDS